MPVGPTRNPRTMAVLAHVGGILGGWIPPLVVYLMDGGRDRYVRHNASEGLNFQLTVQVVTLVLMVPFFVLFFGSLAGSTTAPRGSGQGAAFGTAFGGLFVVWALAMAVSIANIALSITGMVKANRGEWWRYPVRIRFVKGFVPPEERYPA
ncbi:MAG: DUF4870 domain-containing protein [Acidimicrobiales bacterium]